MGRILWDLTKTILIGTGAFVWGAAIVRAMVQVNEQIDEQVD